jgi:prevent-host-death family protein
MAMMTSMAAGKFKNQCLKVLDRVAQTRTPVVITKRGKPVATDPLNP